MKIKFNSDDDLPPRKTVELCYMVIIRSVFHEDNFFLDKYFYKL